jgi:hypothetical protein
MKIEILNPIEHDGKRFERGVVELSDELAKIFLKFKYAAREAISTVEAPAPVAGAKGLPATPTAAPGKTK